MKDNGGMVQHDSARPRVSPEFLQRYKVQPLPCTRSTWIPTDTGSDVNRAIALPWHLDLEDTYAFHLKLSFVIIMLGSSKSVIQFWYFNSKMDE